MKALTVWQPWASLIILGHKPYEFRGWSAHKSIIGTRIAIHAAAKPFKPKHALDLVRRMEGPHRHTVGLLDGAYDLLKMWAENPDQIVHSAIVGTVKLGVPISAAKIAHEFGGPVNDSDRDEHANFAWPMLDVSPSLPPIPARGQQGFWNWTSGEDL